ncbi:MAG: amidohydrolase family protein [Dehalococcoidia bacterium]
MKTKTLLITLTICVVLLSACASLSAPTSSPTLQEISAQTPSPAPPETTPPPTPTPTPTATGPYAGPLFDAHIHLYDMYSGTPAQLSSMKLKSAADLLNYLDRNNVIGAIGFYTVWLNESSNWLSTAGPIIGGSKSRVIPLLQPSPWSDFASGRFNETLLRQYLQTQGLFQGVGEIGLEKPELQTVKFDSSQMQTVFQVVNEKKGVVMIHPNNGSGVRPTDLAEIEPAIIKYPDTIFLFHNTFSYNVVASLMDKYPNVYYSWDFAGSFWQGGGDLLYPADANSNNAASFLATVNQIGLDYIVQQNLKYLAPKIQRYPDRILWGTDFGGDATSSWHFENSVTDMVVKISRELIGRLPADVQDKYAYQNALNVFGRFLTPNP